MEKQLISKLVIILIQYKIKELNVHNVHLTSVKKMNKRKVSKSVTLAYILTW